MSKNVYASPYSSIEVDPEKKLMRVVWFKESIDLNEEQVMQEISKILDYLKEFSISYILVDSRKYPFRNNETLQRWINYTYMPKIVDNGILRYAIVVEKKIQSIYEDFQDEDDVEDDIAVEYFTDLIEAERWIAS
ncbi:MAG TPA: hypothetical protein PL167_06945 [Cyclobacteriaceae bacterium]|nr:hypothetical protein [Cyclobacteriaceae bacterium]